MVKYLLDYVGANLVVHQSLCMHTHFLQHQLLLLLAAVLHDLLYCPCSKFMSRRAENLSPNSLYYELKRVRVQGPDAFL